MPSTQELDEDRSRSPLIDSTAPPQPPPAVDLDGQSALYGASSGGNDYAQGRSHPSNHNSQSTFQRLWAPLKDLSSAPRELWIIFLLKLFVSYSFFSFSVILTLYLTKDFGIDDVTAGWVYGTYGVMTTIFSFFCGWMIDYLGVRGSLLVGACISFIARMTIALTHSRPMVMFMLLFLLPFSESLGVPIMTIAVKRYTNASNCTVAYAMYYTFMNIAALICGPLIDFCRFFFREGLLIQITPFPPLLLSPLRIIVVTGAVSAAMLAFVALFFMREVELDDSGNVTEYAVPDDSPFERTMRSLREPSLWKLTLLTLFVMGVRMLYRHNDAMMPKYLTRQFGHDAPFGLIYSINPLLIITLVPLVGVLTKHVESYDMIMYGSIASGISPFAIVLSNTYFGVVIYFVLLSIGEAVYSPRVYEYAMKLSARGSEGLYSSLSAAPIFAVQFFVGGLSGVLLSTYMPEDGPHRGRLLWSVVGVTSITSPVLLCVLKRFIYEPEPERALALDSAAEAEGREVETAAT